MLRHLASIRMSTSTLSRRAIISCGRKFPQRTFSSVSRGAESISEAIVPPKEHKAIAYWLLGMSGLVAGMVTIGGITRLTRSGLSMTDWTLSGGLPPTTTALWEVEFERYKQFPEWQQRKTMTLDEFKFIYAWEYGHRMMGRFLGIAFVVPLTIFAARGMVPRSLYPRLGLLFGLGGTQGLIGWWMVRSGLNLDPEQLREIRVSPYRLATHLSMAFTTYTVLLWTGLSLLNTPEAAKAVASNLTASTLKLSRNIRYVAIGNGALVATTVLSGAFVAGNDAGRAFNTWPMMGDEWIPSEILSIQPLWRNFFENTATVQFDHRMLAMATLGGIWSMFAVAKTAAGGAYWKAVPCSTRVALNAVTGMSLVQVGLGISTLLLYVPIPLAAVHQAGSLVLLTIITCAVHSLNFATHSAAGITSKKHQAQMMTQMAMTLVRGSVAKPTSSAFNQSKRLLTTSSTSARGSARASARASQANGLIRPRFQSSIDTFKLNSMKRIGNRYL